jgi:hypothetical protein
MDVLVLGKCLIEKQESLPPVSESQHQAAREYFLPWARMTGADKADSAASKGRRFGIGFGLALLVISVVSWLRDGDLWRYLPFTSGVLFLAAWIAPFVLAPLGRAAEWLVHRTGWLTTRLVMILTYYLIFAPIGLIRRLFRIDPLRRRFDPTAGSYWESTDPEGPGSRPDKPY